jgi:type II secretion system protein F domain protein
MVVGGVAFYYYGTVMKEKIQKRSDEMLDEFTEVISKLALLVNAGMTLHEAWEKVANSNEGVLYGEMKISVDNMNNGIPEVDALYEFGQRSMVQEVKKFISTIVQGLTKGNKDLTMMLIQQSKEQWKLKQQYLRRKGEAANSKLLLPMLLIFIAILIMVVVPIFSNIGL